MEPTEKRSSLSEAVRKHKEFLFPAVATYYEEPVALVRGEGEYVWDDAGNRYLDCFGGVLTVSVGHANPTVNQAVIEQNQKLQHTSTLYANENQSNLAEKLADRTMMEVVGRRLSARADGVPVERPGAPRGGTLTGHRDRGRPLRTSGGPRRCPA